MTLTKRQMELINKIAADEASLMKESRDSRYKFLGRAKRAEALLEGPSAVRVDKNIVDEVLQDKMYDFVENAIYDMMSKVKSKMSRTVADALNKHAMSQRDIPFAPNEISDFLAEDDNADTTEFEARMELHGVIDRYMEAAVAEVLETLVTRSE